MGLKISSTLLARLLRESADSPLEVCGLLFGTADTVTFAQSCRNVADAPATRFELDPEMLIAAHKAARAGGPALIGHYHSHPNGSAMPSQRDADAAAPDGSIWVILAAGSARAWRARDDGPVVGRFAPVALLVV